MHAVFNEGKPVIQVNKHDIFKSFSRQLDQVSPDPNLNAYKVGCRFLFSYSFIFF